MRPRAVVQRGVWGIVEKLAVEAIGFAANAGIYAAASTPLYLSVADGPSPPAGLGSRGIREAVPVPRAVGIGGVAIFLAIGLGPVAIVVPLTTAYPVVAILVRRFWRDERLMIPQTVAVGRAMLGAALASL